MCADSDCTTVWILNNTNFHIIPFVSLYIHVSNKTKNSSSRKKHRNFFGIFAGDNILHILGL
jgi:hypothetical protein